VFDIGNTIAAFSEEHVERLTRLSRGRLRYWERTGFFAPTHSEGATRSAFARVYSFRDIVALRTLEMLRVQNNVPLQHLRKVAETLSHLKSDLWTSTTLWVLNRRVIFQEPGTEKPREVVSGQYVIGIKLQQVVSDTQRDVEELKKRPGNQVGRLSRARGISQNALVVAGTRIKVASIVRLHEDGYTSADIIREYPDLTDLDVQAALGHAKAAA